VPTSTILPIFLQARCPSCRPTNSVKAMKATRVTSIEMKNNYRQSSPYSLLFLVFLCLLQFITGPQSPPKEHLDLTAFHSHTTQPFSMHSWIGWLHPMVSDHQACGCKHTTLHYLSSHPQQLTIHKYQA